MNTSPSEKFVCRHCQSEQGAGILFCRYCGRDRLFGFKKWEYLSGGLFLVVVAAIAMMGVNLLIKSIETILVSPTQIVARIASPTTLPPSPQISENLPSAPIQPPTEIISTSTYVPTSCPEITVSITDTPDGDVLHIVRCSDGWKYDSPFLKKGAYSIAPNEKFLVYCTVDGYVYAVRFGNARFISVENIRMKMPIFHVRDVTTLSITFIVNQSRYWATVRDWSSGQSVDVRIPRDISD